MWKIPFESGAYKNGAGFILPAAPKIRKPTTKVVGFFYFWPSKHVGLWQA
jgi:hypothetical protein